MKKIAIDTLPLESGHTARGTGVYTRNIVKALEMELGKSRDFKLEKFVFRDSPQRLSVFELVHYPYFDLFYHSLPLKKATKTVVTVHDVIPLLYPKYYPPGVKGAVNLYLQKRALHNVDAIVTVSETSKKDIVRFLDISKEKIFPIYEAPNFRVTKQSPRKLREVKRKYRLPDDFVLYVGDVNWNKNLINLVKAVKKINGYLVIVGRAAVNTGYDKNHIENQPLRMLQDEYGDDPNILRLGYLKERELSSVWQLATLLCMPSLYEGFGLPVVEAFDARVPVVCSRTQALVEVAGEAAIYFDPKDVSDMSDKISEVLKDKNLRAKIVKAGEERVKLFSWQKAAGELLDVYKKVLEA